MAINNSTGLELVLNACEDQLQLVLTEDEELVCAESWQMGHRGTELLAESLRRILAQSGKDIRNIRRIGCFRGPGSFTGIRLCLTTAAALRRTTRAQLGALDYPQALATTVSMGEQLPYGRKLWILTHARRNLVHGACYQSYGPVIPCYPTCNVKLVSPEDVLAFIRETLAEEGRLHVVGSGLVRNAKLLEALSGRELRDRCFLRPNILAPSLEAIRLLGRHGNYFPRDIEPLYVRPCDAVENIPAIAKKMGMPAETFCREFTRLSGEKLEG